MYINLKIHGEYHRRKYEEEPGFIRIDLCNSKGNELCTFIITFLQFFQ